MGENSAIAWTNHTFNPWIGCTKIAAGCANCYAASEDKRRGWTPEGERMKFFSVCSGIEAASVAWKPLGWHAVGFSEIEPFPCSVLKHHYPDVQNYGDLTKQESWKLPAFDVLCGGTPCQGFSVAGKRGGLDDARSQLVWHFLEIARRERPRWVLWENVPGVLSSGGGADFGAVLGRLGECGYGFAYRILDAQYFGVAQRRRRVFVVGFLGDWRRAAAVLFERESMSGDIAPSRETGEDFANKPANCLRGRGNDSHRADTSNYVAAFNPCTAISPTLSRGSYKPNQCMKGDEAGFSIISDSAVRRLTPRECERLQGFPDDRKSVIIRVCKNEDERQELARSAEAHSQARRPGPNRPAAARALIDLERQAVQLHSPGRSPLFVSNAADESWSRLRIAQGDFVRLGALTTSRLVPATPGGRVEPLLSIKRSSHPFDGSVFVHLCGSEINALAEDAGTFTDALRQCTKSIMSEVGRNSPSYGQSLRTLCCCVAAAIGSFIPERIQSMSSFDLELETVCGYTLVPHRNKPASDGPRYKALGNSWAVPCARYIGERIELVGKFKQV